MDNKCIVCGKDKGRNKNYCSHKCRQEYYKSKNTRVCVICGEEYHTSPSDKVYTCGKIQCKKEYRKIVSYKMNAEGRLKKAWEMIKESPTGGRFETNTHAKTWVIVSPDGTEYNICNMYLWCEQNESILPSPWKRFYFGIVDIKRSIKGTKKKKNYQYKGWTLKEYKETNEKAITEKRHRKKQTDRDNEKYIKRRVNTKAP